MVATTVILTLATACRGPAVPSRETQVAEAQAYLRDGRYADAAAMFDRAARNGEPDGRLLLRQAQALVRAGQMRRATDPARRAADLLPDNLQAQLLAARALLARNAFDEVVERMTALRRREPANAAVAVALGDALAGLNNQNEALTLSVRAGTTTEYDSVPFRVRRSVAATKDVEAERAFQEAISLSDGGEDARMALANFLIAVGRPKEAAEALLLVAAAAPNRALVNHALGVYYWRTGASAEAGRFLERALVDGYRRRDAVTTLLARMDADAGRFDTALTRLLPLVAAGDPTGHASLEAAKIELRLGRRAEALQRLDALGARTPPVVEALVVKARTLVVDGAMKEAVETARSAVNASPQGRGCAGRAWRSAPVVGRHRGRLRPRGGGSAPGPGRRGVRAMGGGRRDGERSQTSGAGACARCCAVEPA